MDKISTLKFTNVFHSSNKQKYCGFPTHLRFLKKPLNAGDDATIKTYIIARIQLIKKNNSLGSLAESRILLMEHKYPNPLIFAFFLVFMLILG